MRQDTIEKKALQTQRHEPRIWSSVIRGLQVPLSDYNIDTDALLKTHEIADIDLQKPHGEIPLRRYLNFLEDAARRADDPLLGLKLARFAGPETLGALGFLFLSSHTLAEALSNFCQYMNLLQDVTHVQLTQNSKEIIFSYELYDVDNMECRQDVEFSIALTTRLIRIYCETSVSITEICFKHSPATAKSEYERILAAPTYFEQNKNSISVPAINGQVRTKVLDHGLSRILRDFLDRELERRNRIQSFADQVNHALLDGGVQPPFTASRIAKFLGVSEATFYRRLKSESTTFSELVDRRNFTLAKSYLADSSLSITEIAHSIGFAESASFTRAFTRWSGDQTPSQYRRNTRNNIQKKRR